MTESTLSPEVRDFLNERRFGVLATINPDGSVQQTVMWYVLEGDTIVMNTRRGRHKDKNILRDPRLSLSLEDEGRFVTISGKATIDPDPERGQQTARALATRYDGEESAEEQMRTGFGQQYRVTIDLPIERVIVHGF
jgi:PPOX class probable F420-dependent enzyme